MWSNFKKQWAISLLASVFCRDQSIIWRANFNLSPNVRLTNFAERKLINYSMVTCWHRRVFLFTLGLAKKWLLLCKTFSLSNGLINFYLVHAKSTGECRLTLDSASEIWSQCYLSNLVILSLYMFNYDTNSNNNNNKCVSRTDTNPPFAFLINLEWH